MIDLMSSFQKKIRGIGAFLFIVLLTMLVIGQYFIDSSQNPIGFIYYYSGVAIITIFVFLITLWDIYQIRKKLRKSLEQETQFARESLEQVLDNQK